LGRALGQFFLRHASLAGQSFFLLFRRLHAILQLFDLGLTGREVLVQPADRRMRNVRGVAERGHYHHSQQQKKPFTGIGLGLYLCVFAFVGHTPFLLGKQKA
jgi:hypothetical protein